MKKISPDEEEEDLKRPRDRLRSPVWRQVSTELEKEIGWGDQTNKKKQTANIPSVRDSDEVSHVVSHTFSLGIGIWVKLSFMGVSQGVMDLVLILIIGSVMG